MKLSLFRTPKPEAQLAIKEKPAYTLDPYMLEYELRLVRQNKPKRVPTIREFTSGVHKLIGGSCYMMSPSRAAVIAYWNGEIFPENNPVIHVFALSEYGEPEVVLKAVYVGESALAYKTGSSWFAAPEGSASFGDAERWAAKISEFSKQQRETKPGLPKYIQNQPDWIKERYCAKRNIKQ